EEKALRICDQRAKVRHRPDSEEDQRRQDRPLVQQIKIIEKSACTVRRFFGTDHNIGIDIYKQHAESDRNKQKRLKAVPDCQIEKNAGNTDHDQVSPCEV